ncbi:OmpA family protein [Ulvibacter litoralis]|uniref:WD40-like Beta Propeller Repeat n=1 Tax=Ulvibacter litoralis TaxID=227084 RepID=A0A1G7GA35_9FLAO|nr:OmpA family protein [Ulvibacter litoralis]GHC57085.1 cell envelope biogenesis protein OmpA [Ulvibacter litoralis]SDE85008.1 WD40-like Beta Propeller Repeat [Ulvibacter litoralis]
MKNILKLFLAFTFLTSSLVSAQEGKIKKGNKEYNENAFIDAQQAYLKVVENGFKTQDVLQKLGDSYYFTADYENATKWYEELYNSYGPSVSPDYLYRYAQSLKSLRRYRASDNIMEKFYAINGNDNRAVFFANERGYLKQISEAPRFEVAKVNFNTKLSDFAPSYYIDKLVFASNGQKKSEKPRTHNWNDQPFLDLYSISVEASEESVEAFSGKVNTKFHESTAVFTKDGEAVYFTRNNYTKGNYKKDANGTNRLKLYRGKKQENGNWDIEELPFNNNEYSVAHPALSVDEKTLYFASDMPGGKGASDLYKVTITDEGFSVPESLGDGINTKERETFPFVSSDNKLYFASDGHVGLGGLDIFVTEIDGENHFKKVYNLGAPLNSPFDDFTFIINAATDTGYFASNRKGGVGDDDIYSFKRTAPLVITCDQVVDGFILDETSKEPIAAAKVVLLDENNTVVSESTSEANGHFTFNLECVKAYSVRATKEGFSTEEKSFASSETNKTVIEKTLLLKKGKDLNVSPIGIGSDLAKLLNLSPINFDLNRYNIRPDAAVELQKVIAVLNEYPTMKIDVRSHTDSRGRDSYNKTLSQKRAQATMDYIVKEGGIDRTRITGMGYGETTLLNHCSNGVKCEDYVHEQNRRSEFIVVEN